jgi:uncharacterized protein (TIGR02147 family)
VNVFEYNDYRLFLRDSFSEARKRNKHLSIREILRRIGSASPSYYKEVVVDSKKNMSITMARKIAIFLKLDHNQANYFLALVGFNQAKTEAERAENYGQLVSLPKGAGAESRFLSAQEYAYLSSWEIPALREVLFFYPTFGNRNREERAKLAAQFIPKVSDEQMHRAIGVLESLGFIEKDGGGNFRKTRHNIRCVNKTPAAYLILSQYMKHALEIINIAEPDSRMFKNLILSMSSQAYGAIERKIQEFCKDILDIVSNDRLPADRLCSLGVQLFPLTKIPGVRKK